MNATDAPPENTDVYRTRLATVRERIADAAARSGRSADAVRLIAVSKTFPIAAIEAMLALDQHIFGENRVEEALDKITALQTRPLEWHFIGHLQSNKTRFIAGNFHWLHSIDSTRLGLRVAAGADKKGDIVNGLIQVNVAQDPAKYGVAPDEVFGVIDELMQQDLKGLKLRGLMTIGRGDAAEDERRRGFARLRELGEQCRARFGETFSELSMGMSDDYALAVEEGATMVRVGSALFGRRG